MAQSKAAAGAVARSQGQARRNGQAALHTARRVDAGGLELAEDPLSPHRIVLGREQLAILIRAFHEFPCHTREIVVAIPEWKDKVRGTALRYFD